LIHKRTGEQKLPETLWGHAEIGLQNALELEQRFVVERYEGEISRPDAGPPKAELDRVRRKRGISLLAREAPGRTVVIEGGNSEDERRAAHSMSMARARVLFE
jgi:hypothetical protein